MAVNIDEKVSDADWIKRLGKDVSGNPPNKYQRGPDGKLILPPHIEKEPEPEPAPAKASYPWWEREVAYRDDQERDDHGRWVSEGGAGGSPDTEPVESFDRGRSGAELPASVRNYAALERATPLFHSPAEHPVVTGRPHAILTGDQPRFDPTRSGGTDAMVSALLDAGVRPDQMEAVDGKYGGPAEKSIAVYDPNEETIRAIGKDFGQESVLFSGHGKNRYAYVNGPDAGKSRYGEGAAIHAHDEGDFRSRIKTKKGDLYYAANIDFESPPR